MRSDIVPPNRFLTIALAVGLLALIAYGAYNRDPATIAIVVALAVFFGAPALLLFSLNRRARQQPPDASDQADQVDQADQADQADQVDQANWPHHR